MMKRLSVCKALALVCALFVSGVLFAEEGTGKNAVRLPYVASTPRLIGGELPLVPKILPEKVSAKGTGSPLGIPGTRFVSHVFNYPGNIPGIYLQTPPSQENGGLESRNLYFDGRVQLPMIATSAIEDDYLYLLGWDLYQQMGGVLAPYYYVIDLKTAELKESGSLQKSYELVALASSQAADGTVYGQFYVDGKGKEYSYGTVDAVNRQRTKVIGRTSLRSVALAVATDGTVYSIAEDGNLYTVSMDTGYETLVGPTGVEVSDGSNYWMQTGEIDPETNTFWWFAIDKDRKSGLYTVDLSTGKATRVDDFGQDDAPFEVVSLNIPPAAARDDAPAIAQNMSVTFVDESLTGTLSFTVPQKTFAGNELQGDVKYKLSENDNILAEGTAKAGASVESDVTTTEGNHTFVLTLENEAGASPKAKAKAWVGYDAPNAVGNLVLSINNDSREVTLTWDAPQGTRHEGYLGSLTYNVYRRTNGIETKVAEAQSETTFSEVLEERTGQNKYAYRVVAINNTQRSHDTWSNEVVVGKPIKLPYYEYFYDYSILDSYMIVDANHDGITWRPSDYYANTMEYKTTQNGKADDWLILPPVTLSKDHAYKFHIQVYGVGVQTYSDRIEVKLGNTATPENMTTTVISPTDIWEWDPRTSLDNNKIVVPEDGTYFFGIHAISNVVNSWSSLCLTEISIEEGAALVGPDAVTNLEAQPDENCELKATLSFDAPIRLTDGGDLKENMSVRIIRNEQEIASLTDIAPGQHVSYTDKSGLWRGVHEYTVQPYIREDNGMEASVNVYVGEDIPLGVRNIKVDDRLNSVVVSWDAVPNKGKYGGYVRPDLCRYQLWECRWLEQFNNWYSEEMKVKTSELYAEHPVDNTDIGEQTIAAWGVGAENDASASDVSERVPIYVGTYVVGKPYELPFQESVTDGVYTTYWTYNLGASTAAIGLLTDAVDNDGGCFAIQSTEGGEGYYAELVSGKIALDRRNSASLTFDAKSITPSTTTGYVEILLPNGKREVLSEDLSLVNGWEKKTFDLSEFKNQRYIRVVFGGRFSGAGRMQIDNISVGLTSTGIVDVDSPEVDGNVYSIDGRLVRKKSAGLQGLHGVYVVGGKKVVL